MTLQSKLSYICTQQYTQQQQIDSGLTHKTLGLLTQIIGILPNIVTKLGSFDVHVRMMNVVKV